MNQTQGTVSLQLAEVFNRVVLLEASHAGLVDVLELALRIIDSAPWSDDGRAHAIEAARAALYSARKLT